MTRELFRIRTSDALHDPDVVSLFDRAFAAELPADSDSILSELETIIEEDYTLVGIARERNCFTTIHPVTGKDYDLVGLVITFLPVDGFNKFPVVYQFYSVGSNKMRNMMIDAVVDWVKENGYNKFLASNFTKRPDCLWKRLFRRAGKLEKVGSIYMFDVGQE